MTQGPTYYVTTEKNGWSTVHGGGELELWRYAWEAQERADELNRRAIDGEYSVPKPTGD